MKVAVVILVWNGKADTLECLESWSSDRTEGRQIILVDNGSTDDSVLEVSKRFPEVIVLSNSKNLGFSAGNNVGIRYAIEHDFDYVMLLNNDTTVEPQALSEMLKAMGAHPRWGMAAPVIHYARDDRDVWFASSRVNLRRGEALHDNTHPPLRDATPYTVPWITGCAILARTSVLRDLEGLDDRYFLSWEDVDLSLRAAKAGWELGVAPAARIYHKGGQASQRLLGDNRDYYDVRNRLLLLRTHLPTGYFRASAFVITKFLARPFRQPGVRFSRRLIDLRRAWYAVVDHLLGRYGEQASRAR